MSHFGRQTGSSRMDSALSNPLKPSRTELEARIPVLCFDREPTNEVWILESTTRMGPYETESISTQKMEPRARSS